MKAVIHKFFLDPTEERCIVFFRYLVSGGFVTIINMILLYLLVEFFGCHYVFADILSMSICIVITYLMSKRFVFTKKVRIGVKKEFFSYLVIAIIAVVVDTTVLRLLTNKLSIYYMLSKVVATAVSTIINYILKRIIYDTFKE